MVNTAKATLSRWASAYETTDKYIIWIVLALSAFGTVAVYSAISFLARTKSDGNTERFLFAHIIRVVLALGVMGVVSLINYRTLAKYSRIALVVSVMLLAAVQIIGIRSGGAERWLEFGMFGFQPSDLAKVALVLYLSHLLVRKQEYIKTFNTAFLPIIAWVLLTVVMIGIDDLSTAAMVLLVAIIMCFVGRVSVIHLGALGLVGLLLGSALIMQSPNRAARIEAYMGVKIFPHTTEEDVFSARAEGYQEEQAKIAFAMGGLTGVGPGKSTQRDFLPAPYNDFIFAIVAEEYGLIGAFGLLSMYLILLYRGILRIARGAPDPLGLVLAVGLVSMLALYGFVHAGVACGLFPVTGLPMPFVSYGGTSMLANGVMIGILLNIVRESANR
ncbi:MAG: cell division protein FtsW [Rhodothermales bacterium]|nr:cell division protein FtsW [Rhodothermales bacterium]